MPHLESKPCSAQSACDANHAIPRCCWRLQEGLLRACADSERDIAFFSLTDSDGANDFEFSFWNRDDSSNIVFHQYLFQRRHQYFKFNSSILFGV